MWAYIKNLVSSKKESIPTDSLFIIGETKSGWTRRKFAYTMLKQVDHEKDKFAKEDGARMVRVLILQMAGEWLKWTVINLCKV